MAKATLANYDIAAAILEPLREQLREIAQAAGHGKESIYAQFLIANANPRGGKPE